MTPTFDPTADDGTILSAITSHYHHRLRHSEKAMAWLAKYTVSKVNDSDALERFSIGYGDRTLGKELPSRGNKGGRAVCDRLKSLGVLKANGREYFRGALTVPFYDAHGEVVAVYGRMIGTGLGAHVVKDLWLGSPAGVLWNRDCLSLSADLSSPRFLVICSTLIDALCCWINGVERVTWVSDDEHLQSLLPLFAGHDVETLVLLGLKTDCDLSGFEAHHVRVLYGKGVWYWLTKEEHPQAALLDVLAAKTKKPRTVTSNARGPSAADAVNSPPAPARTPEEEPADDNGDIHLAYDVRHYRIRGLYNNEKWDVLRINLRVMIDERYHLDHVDLYSAKDRVRFIKHASLEVHMDEEIIKSDLGRILLHLEQVQEKRLADHGQEDPGYEMTPDERDDAMTYLMDENLLECIVNDFRTCGLVGEDANALIGYLASISRKLDDPLSVIIQSSSSAGKSALMDAIMDFVPPEEKIHLTTMTSQSLYYMERDGLKNKTVAISESEGMQRASYALKLLQSEKRLSIATTGRDGKTGRQVTHHYTVEGPIQTLITSTDTDIDEEIQNRAIVLTVSEDREQTRAIHERQRHSHTLEGMLRHHDKDTLIHIHRNVQRLLEPIMVVNPYANELRFMDSHLRSRRDHLKYLNLIRAVTLLHQHQRERHSIECNGSDLTYVESTPDDVKTTNTLMISIMKNSIDDLAPQTRRLLNSITELARTLSDETETPPDQVTLTRKQIREHVNMRNTRLGDHLRKLIEHEYLTVKRSRHGRKDYKIIHCDDQDENERTLTLVTPS